MPEAIIDYFEKPNPIHKHGNGMKISEILKKARQAKKIRQEDIAKSLGITQGTLSLIESGKSLPSYDLLKKLAIIYGLYTNHLLSLLDSERLERHIDKDAIKYDRAEPISNYFILVPVIDIVPGGKPINIAAKLLTEAIESVPVPAHELVNKIDLIGFRVCGDSMVGKGIRDGDTIIVDQSITPVNGDLVVITVNDEVTLKQYFDNGKVITLKSGNREFPDMKFPIASNHIHIYGKVVLAMKLRSFLKPLD